MNNYNQGRTWTHKIAFGVATVAIAVGTLELVAGGMQFPGPEAIAARAQVIAAQSERAYQIRTLAQGQLRLAAAAEAH
jgi:hypothetical protein